MSAQETPAQLSQFHDADLLAALSQSVHNSRAALVKLLGYLGEVDARRLYAREAFPSLFAFCQSLGFSESEAYKRCVVARTARRFSAMLGAIQCGDLHLTGAAMIAAKMTEANHASLLRAALRKSKRSLEVLLAQMFPVAHPAPRAVVRVAAARPVAAFMQNSGRGAEPPSNGAAPAVVVTPTRAANAAPTHACTGAPSVAPVDGPTPQQQKILPMSDGLGHRSAGAPAAPAALSDMTPAERYRLHVDLDAASHAKLREAQALLRHKLPHGDIGQILGLALDDLLNRLHGQKNGRLKRPEAAPSVSVAVEPRACDSASTGVGAGPCNDSIGTAVSVSVAAGPRLALSLAVLGARSCRLLAQRGPRQSNRRRPSAPARRKSPRVQISRASRRIREAALCLVTSSGKFMPATRVLVRTWVAKVGAAVRQSSWSSTLCTPSPSAARTAWTT